MLFQITCLQLLFSKQPFSLLGTCYERDIRLVHFLVWKKPYATPHLTNVLGRKLRQPFPKPVKKSSVARSEEKLLCQPEAAGTAVRVDSNVDGAPLELSHSVAVLRCGLRTETSKT